MKWRNTIRLWFPLVCCRFIVCLFFCSSFFSSSFFFFIIQLLKTRSSRALCLHRYGVGVHIILLVIVTLNAYIVCLLTNALIFIVSIHHTFSLWAFWKQSFFFSLSLSIYWRRFDLTTRTFKSHQHWSEHVTRNPFVSCCCFFLLLFSFWCRLRLQTT